MAPPVPPKPQIVSAEDGGAIVAWTGTFPCGTTFNVYWAAGTSTTAPVQPYPNTYETGLKARTSSVLVGRGVTPVPNNSNLYIAVTAVHKGVESPQSSPLFLSICNATDADEVTVAMDESDQRKLILTDEKGRIFVVTDENAPLVVKEEQLTANDPEVISVGTVSTAIPASALTGRQMMVVQNLGTNVLKLGLSGSELFEVDPRQTVTFTVGDSTSIFGIRDSGTGDVCVWEFN